MFFAHDWTLGDPSKIPTTILYQSSRSSPFRTIGLVFGPLPPLSDPAIFLANGHDIECHPLCPEPPVPPGCPLVSLYSAQRNGGFVGNLQRPNIVRSGAHLIPICLSVWPSRVYAASFGRPTFPGHWSFVDHRLLWSMFWHRTGKQEIPGFLADAALALWLDLFIQINIVLSNYCATYFLFCRLDS